jgi:hypothetical protein
MGNRFIVWIETSRMSMKISTKLRDLTGWRISGEVSRVFLLDFHSDTILLDFLFSVVKFPVDLFVVKAPSRQQKKLVFWWSEGTDAVDDD